MTCFFLVSVFLVLIAIARYLKLFFKGLFCAQIEEASVYHVSEKCCEKAVMASVA